MSWFLNYREYGTCGTAELRQFFYYLAQGHEEDGGRFGLPRLTSPARPITVKDYHVALRCLFDWLVAQKVLTTSPFIGIPKPRVSDEVKMPLTQHQIEGLLQEARRSSEPARDTAILSMLLDTGCRASELVSIRIGSGYGEPLLSGAR